MINPPDTSHGTLSAHLFAGVVALTIASGPAAAATITFKAGCLGGSRLRIAAVGDLLFHKKLQVQALKPSGRYSDFWQPVLPLLESAHITYGNLEGPAADGLARGGRKAKDPGRRFDNHVYQSSLEHLSFNFHPSVISDLKSNGFDVVSTANNHALDRGALGIDRTIANLRARGLPFTGTRMSKSKRATWSVTTSAKGFRIAWLACTYAINGMRDKNRQVALCFRNRATILAEISRLAASPSVDAVILTPHWGSENSHTPNRRQRALARAAIEAGAAAVLGAHPHVLQPWEKVMTKDGREGLVVYSMGNFISNQRQLMQRIGGIVFLDLVKTGRGKGQIAAAGHLPTWVRIDVNGHRVLPASAHAPKSAFRKSRKIWPAGNLVGTTLPIRLPRKCGPGPAAAQK
jgi:hypothetical protein